MGQIKITNLKKTFAETEALKSISLHVREGEFSVLLGPSGCGKTTLLRIVAGLETMTSGQILLGDTDISELPIQKRNIAMVFQNYAIFPHMTVYDNIGFGLKMKKVEESKAAKQIEEAMELMHIEQLRDRLSSQLSGGQRQRVAVARALAMKPDVLLMDEPLSNLDALLRLEMRAELKALLEGQNTTTLYVTHDQIEAMSLADRIAIMYQGEIVQYGNTSEIYHQPATTFVGEFIGNPPMNVVALSEISSQEELMRPVMSLLQQSAKKIPMLRKEAPANLSLGVRADDLVVQKDSMPKEKAWKLKAMVVETLGASLHITTRLGNQLLRVIAANESGIKSGDDIYVVPANPRWFDSKDKLIS